MRDARLTRRWTHPGGTGYQPNLYTMPSLGTESDRIERQLLAFIDTKAAAVLRAARSERTYALQPEDRSALASFVTSLLVRSPESISALRTGITRWWRTERPEIQEIYMATVWQPGLPDSVDEALSLLDGDEESEGRILASVLPELLAHQRIIEFLSTMYWRVLHMPRFAPPLLTSDQPLIMTNGLSHADGHLAVPISPTAILLAARSGIRMDKILRTTSLVQIAKRSNLLVIQRARKFAFAHNDDNRPFVQEHFGKDRVPAIGQKVGDGDPWRATYPNGYIPGRALENYSAWRLTLEE